MQNILETGRLIRFDYPAHNYHGARQRLEPRRLRIEKIRDLAQQPLEAATCCGDPLLRRGQILVTGVDLDKGAERSFYVESMEQLQAISEAAPPNPAIAHRVVLLAPEQPPELVFEAETLDDALLWARHWLREPLGLAVGIVPPGSDYFT